MSLEKRHIAERERLEKLCLNLENRAKDIKSLMHVLCEYSDFCGDPIPHIKAALRDYISIESMRQHPLSHEDIETGISLFFGNDIEDAIEFGIKYAEKKHGIMSFIGDDLRVTNTKKSE